MRHSVRSLDLIVIHKAISAQGVEHYVVTFRLYSTVFLVYISSNNIYKTTALKRAGGRREGGGGRRVGGGEGGGGRRE